jgi:hypothetical protein
VIRPAETDAPPVARHPGGRPRKPEGEKRNVCLRAYLTPAEADQVYAQARAERKTVSEFFADRCLRGVL